MKTLKIVVAAGGLILAASGGAFAQTAVTAVTDLNVRAGPGPQYPITGSIGAGQQATLDGCADGSKWCRVTVNGTPGWAYSDYLTGEFTAGQRVVLTERPAQAVPTVTYEQSTDGAAEGGALAGAATGAIAGALIGGPIGAAIGGVAGAATGAVAGDVVNPNETVTQYVTTNQADPIYLDGEVVVGAGLPDTVELREIPDYEYRYVNINGQPVLVEPSSRRIVYVYR